MSNNGFQDLLGKFSVYLDDISIGNPSLGRRVKLAAHSLVDFDESIRKDERARIKDRLASFLYEFVSEEIEKRKSELKVEIEEGKKILLEIDREKKSLEAQKRRTESAILRHKKAEKLPLTAEGAQTILRLRETIAVQNEELKRLGSDLAY